MSCERFRKLLCERSRHELPQADQAVLDQHLAGCSSCRELEQHGGCMTCEDFTEFIISYRDDELPVEQRTVFESHLGVCADCRDFLDSYDRTVNLSKICDDCPEGDVPPEVPADLITAILKARRATRPDG